MVLVHSRISWNTEQLITHPQEIKEAIIVEREEYTGPCMKKLVDKFNVVEKYLNV